LAEAPEPHGSAQKGPWVSLFQQTVQEGMAKGGQKHLLERHRSKSASLTPPGYSVFLPFQNWREKTHTAGAERGGDPATGD